MCQRKQGGCATPRVASKVPDPELMGVCQAPSPLPHMGSPPASAQRGTLPPVSCPGPFDRDKSTVEAPLLGILRSLRLPSYLTEWFSDILQCWQPLQSLMPLDSPIPAAHSRTEQRLIPSPSRSQRRGRVQIERQSFGNFLSRTLNRKST